MAYGTLRLPFDSLDHLTPLELYWLMENKQEQDKQHYELESYAMRVAFVSANTGKDIKLFEDDSTGPANEITKEERDNTLSALDEIFNE